MRRAKPTGPEVVAATSQWEHEARTMYRELAPRTAYLLSLAGRAHLRSLIERCDGRPSLAFRLRWYTLRHATPAFPRVDL